MAASINMQLLFLEAENPKKEISMYINSPGGVVTAGLSIYDTMQFVKCPISTIVMGQAASMGSILAVAGAKDMRFALPQGFSHGNEFYAYLRDAFAVHYAEGDERPSMMSIGMHCRLLGRPGRLRGLQRFLDHVQRHERVWITRRIDIAQHWKAQHPFDASTAFVWE